MRLPQSHILEVSAVEIRMVVTGAVTQSLMINWITRNLADAEKC